MKRAPKKKLSPLDRMLEHHKPICAIFTYHLKPEERHCSCGRDAALVQLADLRKRAAQNEGTK